MTNTTSNFKDANATEITSGDEEFLIDDNGDIVDDVDDNFALAKRNTVSDF